MMELGEISEFAIHNSTMHHMQDLHSNDINIVDVAYADRQDAALHLSKLMINDDHVTGGEASQDGPGVQGPKCFAIPRGRFKLENKQDKAGEVEQQRRQQQQEQLGQEKDEKHPPRAPRALLDSYRPSYDAMADHDTRGPREERGGYGGRGGGGGGGHNRKRRFNRGELEAGLWIIVAHC